MHDAQWVALFDDGNTLRYRCAVNWSDGTPCLQVFVPIRSSGWPYGGPHTRAFRNDEREGQRMASFTEEEIERFAPRLVWKVTAVPGMWAQLAVVTRDGSSMAKLLGESVTDPSFDGLYADLRSAQEIDALIARLQEVKAEVFGDGGGI